MKTHSASLLILVTVSLTLLNGCGDSDPRKYHVKGTVTYKGAPIPAGTIQFSPAGGNTGPAGYADIVDGKFDTSAEGSKGTVGGAHRITINGFDGNGKPQDELPLGEPLFEEYQIEKDLPKEDMTTLELIVEPR